MSLFRIAICLLFVAAGSSSSFAEKIKLQFKAKAGDKALVTIRKTRPIRQTGGEMIAIFKYDMVIEKASATGYDITWTPAGFDLQGLPSAAKDLLMPQLKAGIIPIRYRTDLSGIPISIGDRDRFLEIVRNFLKKSGKYDPKVFGKIEALFKNMNERQLASVLAKEAGLMAKFQAFELDTKEPTAYIEARTNIFGGAPIKMQTEIKTSVAKDDLLKIEYGSKLTKEQMNLMMKQLSKTVGGPKPPKLDLYMTEKGTAVINRVNGWTQSITHDKFASSVSNPKDRKRIEKIEITVQRR